MVVKIVIGSIVGLVSVTAMVVHAYGRGRKDQWRVDNDHANAMIKKYAADKVRWFSDEALIREALRAIETNRTTA